MAATTTAKKNITANFLNATRIPKLDDYDPVIFSRNSSGKRS